MIRVIQNSFVSGEIAPSLYGRHDLKAYFQACERSENLVPRRTGGLRKRLGTDIEADLTGYEGCRIIPFYFDRFTATLILISGGNARFLIRQPDGRIAVAQKDGADYTLAVSWPDSALASLRHYQMGDTVYISCPGYQAAYLTRYSDTEWTLTPLTGVVSVPAPPSLSATPSGFGLTSDGYTASSVDYALYAIKNGVQSAPSYATAAMTLPWKSGATVTLSWTPNLSTGIDGYILAKKSASYFGVLGRFYPTRARQTVTSSAITTSGAASGGLASEYLFAANHGTALAAADPDAVAASEIKLRLSAYAVHCPRPATGADPYIDLTPAASAAFGTIRLWIGAVCANAARQGYAAIDYVSVVFTVSVQRWTGTAWTAAETFPVSSPASATGYVDIPLADTAATTYKRRVTFSVAAEDSGIILRGVAVYNRAATPALVAFTAALAAPANNAFTCRGLSGYTANLYPTSSTLDVTAADGGTDPAARDAVSDRSCSPVQNLYGHTNAIAVTAAEDSGSYYATVRFAAATVLPEIRLWPGAVTPGLPLISPAAHASIPPNIQSVQIQYYKDAAWHTLPTVYALADAYSAEPVSMVVPDDDTTVAAIAGATAWGLLIKTAAAGPVIIRGCQLHKTTVQSRYVDDYVSPSETVPTQTYIGPGSSDMAVDLISMFQQRLVLAASNGRPFTCWFSKTADLGMWYANSPLLDTDPFAATIPATRAARILHMMQYGYRLILFTEGGLYVIAGNDSDGFTYRTASINQSTYTGALPGVPPVPCVDTFLYVADDGRTVYELDYDITQDGVVPVDRSVMAAHLTEASPVRCWAWAPAPDHTLWIARADGSLVSFTYMHEHEVYAWARHTLPPGMTVLDIIAPGNVETGKPDCETATKVYLLASYNSRLLLLRLRAPLCTETPAVTSAAALDAAQAVTSDGSTLSALAAAYPAGPVTALNLADGTASELTSDGTGITPVPPAGEYIVGIPVAAELRTLRTELQETNIQGIRKRVTDVMLRLYRSRSVTVAPSDNPSASSAYPQSSPQDTRADGRVDLISQDILIHPPGSYNFDGRLTIADPSPWPLEIQNLVLTVDLSNQ